jgi:hypothetical protein
MNKYNVSWLHIPGANRSVRRHHVCSFGDRAPAADARRPSHTLPLYSQNLFVWAYIHHYVMCGVQTQVASAGLTAAAPVSSTGQFTVEVLPETDNGCKAPNDGAGFVASMRTVEATLPYQDVSGGARSHGR